MNGLLAARRSNREAMPMELALRRIGRINETSCNGQYIGRRSRGGVAGAGPMRNLPTPANTARKRAVETSCSRVCARTLPSASDPYRQHREAGLSNHALGVGA